MSGSTSGPCANVQATRCASRSQNGKKNQGCKHGKCKQCCLRDHLGECSTPSHRISRRAPSAPVPPPPVAPSQQPLLFSSTESSSPTIAPSLSAPPPPSTQPSTGAHMSLADRTAGHAQPLHNMWTVAPAGWAQLRARAVAGKEAVADRKKSLNDAKAADQRRIDIRVWKQAGQAPFLSTAEVKNYPFFRIADHHHLVAQLTSTPPPAPFDDFFAQIFARQKGWVLTSFTTERRVDTSEKELLIRFVAPNQLAGPFLGDEDCPNLPRYAFSSLSIASSTPSSSKIHTPPATPMLKRVRSRDAEDTDEHPAKRQQASPSPTPHSSVSSEPEPDRTAQCQLVQSRSSPGPITAAGDESSGRQFLRVHPHLPSSRRSVSTIVRSTLSSTMLPSITEEDQTSHSGLSPFSSTLSHVHVTPLPRRAFSEASSSMVGNQTLATQRSTPAYGPDDNHVQEGEVSGVRSCRTTNKPEFPSWWFVCYIKEGFERGEAARAGNKSLAIQDKVSLAFPGVQCSEQSYNKVGRFYRNHRHLFDHFASMGKTPDATFHCLLQEIERLKRTNSGVDSASQGAVTESVGSLDSDSPVGTPNVDDPSSLHHPDLVADEEGGNLNAPGLFSFSNLNNIDDIDELRVGDGLACQDFHGSNLSSLTLSFTAHHGWTPTTVSDVNNDPFVSLAGPVAGAGNVSSGFILHEPAGPFSAAAAAVEQDDPDADFSALIKSLPPNLFPGTVPLFPYNTPATPPLQDRRESFPTHPMTFDDNFDIPPLTPNGLASVLTPKTSHELTGCLARLSGQQ
ncbi:hypothetical protein OF83DRAFT_1282434 [Amylostereum chailletii]|nr:hypothetical protein OF83DRAFT_1282434 [Amylostereum chailletii]